MQKLFVRAVLTGRLGVKRFAFLKSIHSTGRKRGTIRARTTTTKKGDDSRAEKDKNRQTKEYQNEGSRNGGKGWFRSSETKAGGGDLG